MQISHFVVKFVNLILKELDIQGMMIKNLWIINTELQHAAHSEHPVLIDTIIDKI